MFNQLIFSQTSIPKAQSLFVYNFTRLIEWPSAYKTGDFIIGTLGTGDIVDELGSTMTGKKIGAQSVKVENYNNASEIGRCNILFITFSKSGLLEDALAKLGNESTLIITEKTGFAEKGAVINFVVVGNSLKFELSKAEATKRNLIISSALEKMAIAK